MSGSTFLYRLVNQVELDLIETSGRAFPLWVPAEQLAEFNQHIQGLIEITATFRR